MSKAVLTEYDLDAAKLTRPLTVALVADLHERPADDILALLRQAKPDVIAIAGDTLERCGDREQNYTKQLPAARRLLLAFTRGVNRVLRFLFMRNNHPDTECAYRFLRGASEICPVYMALGNHEDRLVGQDYRTIAELGVHLLDNADGCLTLNGQKIRVGGLSSQFSERWLKRFSRKDGYKILLCHHPEYYDSVLTGANVDLVLSGHNHGGQLRLFGKGLISSTAGLFPKYDKGVYDNRLVVSAGCSNTAAVPRIHNPREAVIIRLHPTD